MSLLNASELYQFALQIEENGEKFYRQMASKFDDSEVVKVFNYLAAEEVNHKVIFTKLLSEFEDYKPAESYPGEYFEYLKAYSDNLVFSFENFDDEVANIKDVKGAIRFALEKEVDTIGYFQEVKNMVPDSEKDKIEDIINEERRHVVKLFELKKKY